MVDYLGDELDSELVIGIVNAVGTQTELVVDLLRERLGCAGYRVEVVKISKDVIRELAEVQETNDNYKRISSLMDAGNNARMTAQDDSVLAYGAATCIFRLRKTRDGGYPEPLCKTAIIVDSLKRPEEVEKLRLIYPSGFVLLGIHCEESRRKKHLVENLSISAEEADELIRRDSEESNVKHGQRVNNAFHLADFFVRIADNHERLRCDIKRMVELWFGNPFITPTFDEHAMFLAFAAALRSADLSRQVGAVVTRDSQILSTGANECPQAGGGLYWPTRAEGKCISDVPGGRDFTRPDGDSNRAEQLRIIGRIVDEAKRANYQINPDNLRDLLLASGIRDLTEYGRVVHAEMEALLSCARTGQTTVGASLYCTTFPCHNCAKHIIAAGIGRVVYVQPYPKSKTFEFHDDSISSGVAGEPASLVRFDPFVGIGPRRFFDLFSMQLGSTYPLIRKDSATGKAKEWRIDKAQLRLQMKPVSYLELELQACKLFGDAKPKPVEEEKK